MSSNTVDTNRIAVALGGGGARGFAHIAVVEALDDLGITPVAIAGTSMGAVIGAAWAAGLRGKDIRAHCLALTRDRAQLMARILRARVGRFVDLFAGQPGNPMLLDAERLLDLVWPQDVPDRFEELKTPFIAVATDFYDRKAVTYDRGPLAPAVAASMAIPGLAKGVEIDGRVLFDGGITEPLPHRRLMTSDAELKRPFVIACDVIGGPVDKTGRAPGPFAALLGASQILQGALSQEMLVATPPDLLLRPPVDHFRLLDFARLAQILTAAEATKDEIKHALGRVLEG
jgi:NTE family protein